MNTKGNQHRKRDEQQEMQQGLLLLRSMERQHSEVKKSIMSARIELETLEKLERELSQSLLIAASNLKDRKY